MLDIKISIIVAVYNIEKYLPKCLDSILAQTYQNLQIILVDDGSSDSSACICDEYAEKDHRIEVIHKKNGGLSDARNAGLECATGEYIGYVDGDDWIEPEMYATMIHTAKERQVDVVICAVSAKQILDQKLLIQVIKQVLQSIIEQPRHSNIHIQS